MIFRDKKKTDERWAAQDVKKPMKRSQDSLSLSLRWTIHVIRPFNLYKEGQGTPKRDKQQTISRARYN